MENEPAGESLGCWCLLLAPFSPATVRRLLLVGLSPGLAGSGRGSGCGWAHIVSWEPSISASADCLAQALSSFHTGKHKEQHWELRGSAGQVCDSRETWGHREPVVIFGWCILRSAGPQGALEVVCTPFPYLCGSWDLQVLY